MLKENLRETIFGQLTEEEYKKTFHSIFEDVKNRTYFKQGCVHFSTDLGFGKFTVKTFKKKEKEFIMKYAPVELMTEDYLLKNIGQLQLYNKLLLLLGVATFEVQGQEASLSVEVDSTIPLEDWLSLPNIKDKLAFFDELPEQLVSVVIRVINDVTTAFNVALNDLLKNRPTPQ